MGLLGLLFPPPPTLLDVVRRHDLPALERVVKKEGHYTEGGAGELWVLWILIDWKGGTDQSSYLASLD